MKVKIVGFRVGESRPTANKTITLCCANFVDKIEEQLKLLGPKIYKILEKSDFISIRRIEE